MTGWQKAQSSTKPMEFDTTSSSTTVYQRKNITEVTKENEINAEGMPSTMWEYDERKMSHDEYLQVAQQYNSEKLNTLSSVLDDIQLALLDLDAAN